VVTRFYLFSLPGVVVAIFIGRVINRKMDARLFPRYVHAGLIGIGAILLIQSL
jgi:hypothetical protein